MREPSKYVVNNESWKELDVKLRKDNIPFSAIPVDGNNIEGDIEITIYDKPGACDEYMKPYAVQR